MRISRWVVLSFLAVALLGCTESPTEPPVHTSYDGGSYGLGVRIRNADGAPTLLRAEILVDGVLLANQSNTPVGSEILVSGTAAVLPLGSHVISIRIREQTVSPSPYVLTYLQITHSYYQNGVSSTPQSYSGPLSRSATLATGESISFETRTGF